MNIRDLCLSLRSRPEAEKFGFAGFNNNPHLCIELTDEPITLTVKTKAGAKVTFAFVPGAAQCFDIQHHNGGATVRNGDREVPVQRCSVHTVGSLVFVGKTDDAVPATLISLSLKPHAEARTSTSRLPENPAEVM